MGKHYFSRFILNCGAILLGVILTAQVASASNISKTTSQLKGVVRDESGLAVAGATVVVEGTSTITITDGTGEFALPASSEECRLEISFLGYQTAIVPVTNSMNDILVVLKDDNLEIDEVVVVGYGVQKKENLTGAVSYIGAEEFESRPVANASQMLQGAMPNVNVTFANGAPNSEGTISIRGQASINGGDPLVLIDGVPGEIDRINAADIESISVLKDASASAIYGARGAFGVILVTTKKGKEGKTRVTYNMNYAVATPTVSTDFMTNGYEYLMLCDEAMRRYSGNTYTRYTEDDYAEVLARQNDTVENSSRPWVVTGKVNGVDAYNYYGNFDWWDYTFSDLQPSHQHDISISGGNDKVNYILSGSYYHKTGIWAVNPDKYTKYNFRSKVEAQVFPFMKISNNTQYFDSKYAYTGEEDVDEGFTTITEHAIPVYVPINPDGTASYTTNKNSYTFGDGFFAMLEDGNTRGQKSIHQFRTTTSLQFDLGKYVKLNADYTFQMSIQDDWYRESVAQYSVLPGVLTEVPEYNIDRYTQTMSYDPMQVFNAYGSFNKSFGKHTVSATAGVNYEYQATNGLSASRKDLISSELNDLNLGTGDMTVAGGQTEYALFGAFGRVNYDYDGKYLFEMSGRYDGTSKYESGTRYGFFPSFSAGWRISKESFFEPIKRSVNDLKIRASYGSLGNQLSGSNMYPYISSMSISTGKWISNGTKVESTSSPSPVADYLTWEVATTSNIGIDAAFLNNRLTFTADAYIRDTKDMLIPGEVLPSVFGADSPDQNAGDLRTKGYEFVIGWRDRFNLADKSFNYSIQASFGDATSTITKYDNPNKLLTSYYEGMKLGEMWGYKIDGFFQTDAEAASYSVNQAAVNGIINSSSGDWNGLRAGDLRFVDVNGDGVISSGTNTYDDHGDLVIIGNSTPRFNYGFNFSADWNGFDISTFFQGVGRCNWYPGTNADKFWGPYSRPYFSFFPENFTDLVWTEDNRDAYFPVLRGYTALSTSRSLGVNNDKYVQNIGYLRLKSLVVGYTLPKHVLDKLNIEQVRFYFSGENLLTFSPLESDYIDPEQAMADSNGRTYPMNKTFSFGINLTF